MEKAAKSKVILVGKGYGWWDAGEGDADTDVYGINDLIMKRIDIDLLFNLHLLEDYSEGDMACVNMASQLGIPVIMPKKYEQVKTSVEFPLEEAMREFDTDYFMTGIAYMIAYAIMKEYKQIDLYGINMRGADEKYKNARACVEFWIGVAKGRGIKVNVHGKYSDCLKAFDRRLYGYNHIQTYPENINDRALYLTYGVGLEMEALERLYELLSKQPDSKYHNNFRPIPLNDPGMGVLMSNIQRIVHEQGDGVRSVGDIGFYNLLHVDAIINTEHSCKIVCLKGDKEKTIQSWLRYANGFNFWTDPKSKHWNGDKENPKYSMFFPKYDLPKEEALSKFYDDYYAIAQRAQQKYPGYVRNWDNSILDTEEGQRELLSFIGYEDKDMVIKTPKKEALCQYSSTENVTVTSMER